MFDRKLDFIGLLAGKTGAGGPRNSYQANNDLR
jgi:hypothetical protein